jgi:hypothetical protein
VEIHPPNPSRLLRFGGSGETERFTGRNAIPVEINTEDDK